MVISFLSLQPATLSILFSSRQFLIFLETLIVVLLYFSILRRFILESLIIELMGSIKLQTHNINYNLFEFSGMHGCIKTCKIHSNFSFINCEQIYYYSTSLISTLGKYPQQSIMSKMKQIFQKSLVITRTINDPMHALNYINLITRAKGGHPLWPHYLWLNPQRTGVFYKRKGRGGH